MKSKLQQLIELEAKRTQGKWQVACDDLGTYLKGISYGSGTLLTDDAQWIALCSELVPKLLELARAAEEMRGNYRAAWGTQLATVYAFHSALEALEHD